LNTSTIGQIYLGKEEPFALERAQIQNIERKPNHLIPLELASANSINRTEKAIIVNR